MNKITNINPNIVSPAELIDALAINVNNIKSIIIVMREHDDTEIFSSWSTMSISDLVFMHKCLELAIMEKFYE